MGERLLRLPDVRDRTGLSRSAIYQYMSEGRFPKSIPIGSEHRIGWVESEVDAWVRETIRASKPEVK